MDCERLKARCRTRATTSNPQPRLSQWPSSAVHHGDSEILAPRHSHHLGRLTSAHHPTRPFIQRLPNTTRRHLIHKPFLGLRLHHGFNISFSAPESHKLDQHRKRFSSLQSISGRSTIRQWERSHDTRFVSLSVRSPRRSLAFPFRLFYAHGPARWRRKGFWCLWRMAAGGVSVEEMGTGASAPMVLGRPR